MVNYESTFITVAADCPATRGQRPPATYRGRPTVAAVQFTMIHDRPYRYTQEDVLFASAQRRPGAGTDDDELAKSAAVRADVAAERARYLDQDLACLRASPLPKRYGWGLHFDEDGRVAAYAVESLDYERLAAGDGNRVRVLAAMRSRRG